MNLKLYDVFKHLLKWKYRIIAVVILAFFLARAYVSSIQTTSGQVLIKYNDACIAEGEFPDGSKFEQYQITSPEIIQNVINKLNLSETVETIRRRVDVSPVVPTNVKEMQTAKTKSGEEYVYNPTIFMVSYWGMPNQPAYKIRELLEAIVFEYFDYYSKSYSNYASTNKAMSELDVQSYDYIEVVQIIENNVIDIISKLEKYKSNDPKFRSASSGASFQDMIHKYEHLRDFDIPKIYANIYKGGVSKDRDRLVELYKQNADESRLKQKNFQDMAQMTKEKIDSFAVANKEVPNAYNYKNNSTNNDDLEIIEDIHNNGILKSTTKTTYDTLLENYTNQMISANDAGLQASRYENLAGIFSSEANESIATDALVKEVEGNISALNTKMNRLSDTLTTTINDYNDYSVQKHISLLTGVKCYENVSNALYEMVAVVISFCVMVMLALIFEISKSYKKQKNDEEENKETS